jgi:uncharacterized paraquat-inducible protein A
MKKEEIQKIIDEIKPILQEYWVNQLSAGVQIHSMALMDQYIDRNFSDQFGDMRVCYSCRLIDGTGREADGKCIRCGKPLCVKCSFFANDYSPTGPLCGKCGF